jgi:hypothetical protein
MSRQQTRRSVSVKGLTYQRIEDYVATTGGSLSGFLEQVIAGKIGEPSEAERAEFDVVIAREPEEVEELPKEPDPAEDLPKEPDPAEDRRKFDETSAKEQVSIKNSRSRPTPVAPKVEDIETPDELKGYIPPNLLL